MQACIVSAIPVQALQALLSMLLHSAKQHCCGCHARDVFNRTVPAGCFSNLRRPAAQGSSVHRFLFKTALASEESQAPWPKGPSFASAEVQGGMASGIARSEGTCEKQVRLQRLRDHAATLGGKCLAEEYLNNRTKILWRCIRGHTWYATSNHVLSNKSWCPHCAKKAPIGLERLRTHAASLGGHCLATEYANSRQKVSWQCKFGHVWEASPSSVLNQKNWCPKCACLARSSRAKQPRVQLMLHHLQQYAVAKHGLCLAKEYINSKTKVLWQCELKHEWHATPSSVLHTGSWCPTCAGNARKTLQQMRTHAEALGGRCLSTDYSNNYTPLRWTCHSGHQWLASALSVMSHKSWCPHCAKIAPIGLIRLQAHAESLGGSCLSRQYTNSRNMLLWECKRGHAWKASASNILHGSTWCPHCAALTWKNESEVRQVLEAIFAPAKFDARFPAFLQGLQLDGYCPELNLAFEYHGEQHYDPENYFHFGDPSKFQRQQERDSRKVQLCDQAGVRLVVVPFFVKDKHSFVRLALLQWFSVSEVNPVMITSGMRLTDSLTPTTTPVEGLNA
ncbi:unnamed protein product [Symbiodinium natans]|uniref:Treble clef zinc finger domain-containing protein n=1 Tax=Symbiodinium natans TaxID=878477 RepID=A0A812KW30_9DINO|nr:unnamed protein product [Symbiodinium natans]